MRDCSRKYRNQVTSELVLSVPRLWQERVLGDGHDFFVPRQKTTAKLAKALLREEGLEARRACRVGTELIAQSPALTALSEFVGAGAGQN